MCDQEADLRRSVWTNDWGWGVGADTPLLALHLHPSSGHSLRNMPSSEKCRGYCALRRVTNSWNLHNRQAEGCCSTSRCRQWLQTDPRPCVYTHKETELCTADC